MTSAVLVMIGLSTLNMIFFSYIIIYNQYYLCYIIYITLSYFLYRRIYFKHIKEYHGLPVELYFFLPGLGGMLVSMTLFLLEYVKSDSLMIQDYENYIRFQNYHIKPENFDYNASVQTMSALDIMSYYGDKMKKELIVNHDNGLKKEGIELLRQGNIDEDTEVQHYAAVTLNSLENELNNEIRYLHVRLKESNNSQVLDRLLELYKAYIYSSLLEEDTLQIYNRIYVDLLEKRNKAIGETYKYSLDLYHGYIRQMAFRKAKSYYQFMVTEYGENPEMLLLKMQLDFQVHNSIEIQKNKVKLEKIYNEQEEILTNKQESQIAFWIGKQGKEGGS